MRRIAREPAIIITTGTQKHTEKHKQTDRHRETGYTHRKESNN